MAGTEPFNQDGSPPPPPPPPHYKSRTVKLDMEDKMAQITKVLSTEVSTENVSRKFCIRK